MRLPAIDALRLFAALCVVAFHYLFRGPVSGWVESVRFPLLDGVARYGFLGVELFFIISGFVIAWSVQGRTAGEFVRARVLRLWPGFLFCMTATAVALEAAGNPLFPANLKMWLANVIVMPQLVGQPFVDGVYWSLVIEIIFYGWVALLLWSGLWQRYFAVIGCVWLGIATLNNGFLHIKLLERLFLTPYAGEFLGGVILYRVQAGLRGRADLPLFAGAVAVALGQTGKIVEEMRVAYQATVDPLVLAALILCAFVLVSWASRIRLSEGLAAWTAAAGAISYPLYLLHQNLGYVLIDRLVPAGVPGGVAVLIVAAGVMAASYGVAAWVEPAGRRVLGRLWPSSAQTARVLPAEGRAS